MGFFVWLTEWIGHSTLYIQIGHDSGFFAARNEMMPMLLQEVYDRLERWVSEDHKK